MGPMSSLEPDDLYQSAPPELSETTAARPAPLENAAAQARHDPYAALRVRDYRRYFTGNAFSLIGSQMASAAVAYELYKRTQSRFALGMVGFVQILPIILLTLPAGHLVDRLNRKRIVLTMTAVLLATNLLMGISSHFADRESDIGLLALINHGVAALARLFGETHSDYSQGHIAVMLMLLFVNGVVRSFMRPAAESLLPSLVSEQHLSNAVTWNASLFETTNMVGPALAGGLIGVLVPRFGPTGAWTYAPIYFFNAFCQLVQFVNFSGIHLHHAPKRREPLTIASLLAGAKFVYTNKVILGMITLDMFAVLLGGATALLPVFSDDILHVGPVGFGFLRAAPSVGAILMAMFLAHRPPMTRAGRNLLWAVVGFGIATIVFGISRNFWVSLVALFFTGAFDNISVVVRHSTVQIATPDDMRGRVNAVNSLFISTSNQLGEFESATTAAIAVNFFGAVYGPMAAVIAGGAGTILVVAAVAFAWPQVGAVKTLTSRH
jgi:MFS family permease